MCVQNSEPDSDPHGNVLENLMVLLDMAARLPRAEGCWVYLEVLEAAKT